MRPDTKPAAPQVSVGGSSKKPSATIVLQSFTGVEVSKLRAIIEAAMKSKKKGKVGFQYRVQVSATKDAAGNPVSKKLKDIRNLTSKRNTLTVKNLKANSTYDVNYRVEITRKLPGEKPKVFKKTPLSPTSSFVVQ